MKLFVFIAACFFTTAVSAKQLNDTIPAEKITDEIAQSYKPSFTLTQDQLAHLPFRNIMEVLNGMFPFVFGDAPNAYHYNFLVNGKLLFNPNAINISQISSIEFYPVYFGAGNASLAGRGTFIITTTTGTAPNGFSIRSQTGLIIPTKHSERYLFNDAVKANKREMFTYQDIGYNYADNKFQVSSAISYTRNALPGYEGTSLSISKKYDHGYNRVRFSNFLGYNVNDKLKLTASFALYTNPIRFDIESKSSQGFATMVEGEGKTLYGVGTAGIEYRFSSNVSNSVQVEYSAAKKDADSYQIDDRPGTMSDAFINNGWGSKTGQFTVINSLKGSLPSTGKIQWQWELLLRYFSAHADDETRFAYGVIGGPSPILSDKGELNRKHRNLAAMPRIAMTVSRQLFVNTGFSYNSWQNNEATEPGDYSGDGWFPYAGIRWSMPASNSALSSLHIHSTYTKTLLRYRSADQLNTELGPDLTSVLYPYYINESATPGYTWMSGIDAGFAKERLLISLNYFRGNSHRVIDFGSGFNPVRSEQVNESGLSASVLAKIADNEQFRFSLRGILFYERGELDNESLAYPQVLMQNDYLNADYSPQWHGSIQANISSYGAFLQAMALLRPAEAAHVYNGSTLRWEKHGNSGLAFLAAGYRFGSIKKLKDLEVSIQCRNLLLMKAPEADYYRSRYIGIGLNARL